MAPATTYTISTHTKRADGRTWDFVIYLCWWSPHSGGIISCVRAPNKACRSRITCGCNICRPPPNTTICCCNGTPRQRVSWSKMLTPRVYFLERLCTAGCWGERSLTGAPAMDETSHFAHHCEISRRRAALGYG
ncbi:hypothetical protein MAPG_01707 [Magnaporthiopsis poae ATCC 64411]|uniref:Uncharacterized protein n=1 Tax=Magnaporthiopsis poae (strain ATCC 64411 / 73-15) TaxID=644358 RepID=A0A0C4DPE3_MAGP6|nr:hypothetical protein MAPG_01707 [Magnaporthiopsis poae ATCC 64411]